MGSGWTCWMMGTCDRYKRKCEETKFWVCPTGEHCGENYSECSDDVQPNKGNIDVITSTSCGAGLRLSEGECEAYANMVGKKFELRSKDQQLGCYQKTVHGVNYVLYQKVKPQTLVPCSKGAPCVCWKGDGDSDSKPNRDADLAEVELAK